MLYVRNIRVSAIPGCSRKACPHDHTGVENLPMQTHHTNYTYLFIINRLCACECMCGQTRFSI